VSFTIERWIVVTYPMRRRLSCTESRAKRVTIVVFVLSFLAASPTPFEWQVREVLNKSGQVTISYVPSALGQDPLYKQVTFGLSFQ
jgi:hypothetical protein